MQPLQFKNGSFKIMQITDTQEHHKISPDTVKLIRLALERERPDLVVFTGDQIAGYSPTFRGNPMKKITETIDALLQPLDDLGVPFCVTFGNHDNNCGIANAMQMPIYAAHRGFVQGTPRTPDDQGTFSLCIKDSAGQKNVFALYLIDSGGKEPNGIYAPVQPEQIAWFRAERDRLFDENGTDLPALVFQHIPLPEYYDVLQRVPKGTPGAVEAFFSHKNEFYVLPESALEKGDFMHESPAAPDENTGEFAAFKERGNVLGVYCGHDHINSFSLPLDGIDLGYTQGSGFHVYGPGGKRGVRVFTLNEETPNEYQTYTVTMEDLCDFKPAAPLLEFTLQHMPASVQPVLRALKRTGLAVGAAAVGILGYRLLKKRK